MSQRIAAYWMVAHAGAYLTGWAIGSAAHQIDRLCHRIVG